MGSVRNRFGLFAFGSIAEQLQTKQLRVIRKLLQKPADLCEPAQRLEESAERSESLDMAILDRMSDCCCRQRSLRPAHGTHLHPTLARLADDDTLHQGV